MILIFFGKMVVIYGLWFNDPYNTDGVYSGPGDDSDVMKEKFELVMAHGSLECGGQIAVALNEIRNPMTPVAYRYWPRTTYTSKTEHLEPKGRRTG